MNAHGLFTLFSAIPLHSNITLSAFADQKIFGSMPCPIVVLQVLWLLTTPWMAHGVVSQNAEPVL